MVFISDFVCLLFMKSPPGPTWAITSRARLSSLNSMPRTTRLFMSAISSSTTALPKSKAMSELNRPPMLSSVAPASTAPSVFMPVS